MTGISLITEMNNPAPPACFLMAAAPEMKGLNLKDQQKWNLQQFLLQVPFPMVWPNGPLLTEETNEVWKCFF